ncbi:MAG: type II secretion system protein [Rickettsiales bacterium]
MNKELTAQKNRAFALMEMAIVLTLIALVLAGIAAGGGLIKQAELRSAGADLAGFKNSYNSFIAAYGQPPGDISNATSYFNVGDCEITSGACNGDGNGLILSAKDSSDEVRAAMKHLSLAGLLSEYIAAVTINTSTPLIFGVSAPKSRIDNAGYMMVNANITGTLDDAGAMTPIFNIIDNAAYLGAPSTAGADILINGALSPYDAYNIDKKMDDGSSTDAGLIGASTGEIRTINANNQNSCVSSGYYQGTSPIFGCLLGIRLN